MGCLSHRRKQTEETADQRWEYINLKDFRAKGCGTVFAYIYLWIMLLISVAVYAVDSFTAVNLLAFNRWSGGIDPAISIDISKWIFSICIILSFLNLAYEGYRAFKVIRRGNVAECYLDSLAVRWESIRMGSGHGFRRFLVFAELTKSKKGAEYIALFTYFSFQSWIRVIICSGPRQVINAFTIKAVYESQLAISNEDVGGSIKGFFEKIKTLAEKDYRQALTLSGMCFTLVVWVFSALFLLTAVLFWVFFLWHWIPSADGGLSGYCGRKVTKTLMKIVTKTVNKALAREEANRLRAEFKTARKNGEKPPMERMATLPTLPNVGPLNNDKLPDMPMLGRNDTMMTLPAYSSRPGTPRDAEMNKMEQRRPVPSRTGTMASNATYSSRAPLVSTASEMGYGRAPSPTPQVPNLDLGNYPPPRSATASSQRNFGSQPLRPMLSTSSMNRFTETPAPIHGESMPFPPPARAPSARPMDSFSQSGESFGPSSATRGPAQRTYEAYNPEGRASPAPMDTPYWNDQQRPMNQPVRSATGPPPPRGPQYPQRNMTAPMPPRAPAGEYADPYSTTSPVASASVAAPRAANMRSATGPLPPRGPPQYPPQRNMTAPMPPLAAVGEHYDRYSTASSGAGSIRASPAPRMGPSPGPGGPPRGYDVESQRGREYWN
ncbi:Potassium transporter [Neonectria punicea]|uniref:Potassium transporter n=1 Tax=Neonectria punicea TaxID=979145 RepID=A0ABR1GU28_9HYPO